MCAFVTSKFGRQRRNDTLEEIDEEIEEIVEMVNNAHFLKSDSKTVPEQNAVVKIKTHLKNVLCPIGSRAVFQCLVEEQDARGIWYHNSVDMQSSATVKINATGNKHELAINPTSKLDEGVYTFICINNRGYAISQASLDILLPRQFVFGHGAVYHPPGGIAVTQHLRSARVEVGNTVELIARFRLNSGDDIQHVNHAWFKNNEPLTNYFTDLMAIEDATLITRILIPQANYEDSGKYVVVAYTSDGFASSSCHVLVSEIDFFSVEQVEDLGFVEPLKDETEAVHCEPITLLCKVTDDEFLDIKWFKDGMEVEENPNRKLKFHGNRRYGLHIQKPTVEDMGEYAVEIKSLYTPVVSSSKGFLSVSSPPYDQNPEISVTIPLKSVITTIGANVCLNCAFDLRDERFYHVVWFVGSYRVERNTSDFQLTTNGKDFILLIKNVDPDMFGEVSCHLRRYLPGAGSVAAALSTAQIVQVPLTFLHDQLISFNTCLSHEKLFIDIAPESCRTRWNAPSGRDLERLDAYHEILCREAAPATSRDRYLDDVAFAVVWKIEETETTESATPTGTIETEKDRESKIVEAMSNVLTDILYCRINDTTNFITLTNCRVSEPGFDVVAFDLPDAANITVRVMWDHVIALSDSWYQVEVMNAEMTKFTFAGYTSKPVFNIADPVADQIIWFRIRTVKVIDGCISSSIVIAPPPARQVGVSNRNVPLEDMKDFDSNYYNKTDIVLGHGAFGDVVLLETKDENTYAMKILKTKMEKKRKQANREYEILSCLHHERIVQLFGAYSNKHTMFLIMDYLWGGELFERIIEEENFKEDIAIIYVRQIVEGLVYLHDMNVAHLDLKPENIVCLHPNSRRIKLVDFGLSRKLNEGGEIRAIYGTRDYISPETLNYEPLSLSCDLWSLGVVTYVMLTGNIPFSGENWLIKSTRITQMNYNYDELTFFTLSTDARDFIDCLLVAASDRLTARQALNHPWLVKEGSTSIEIGRSKDWRTKLRAYLESNKARWQVCFLLLLVSRAWWRLYGTNNWVR